MFRLPHFSALTCIAIFLCLGFIKRSSAQTETPAATPQFNVIAFYTGKEDLAHISFVHEANPWFEGAAKKFGFHYESTTDWTRLSTESLKSFQVVLFLDTRPEAQEQRDAFQQYMEHGGAWIGFHFAGFALTPSKYPQNWDWYHHEFLGTGSYVSNTWKPVPAILRVEDLNHPFTKGLPQTFTSCASEWYQWEKDLRSNPNIKVLLSIDPSSFPLGTKEGRIWRSGDYPIAWTNQKYRMLYMNMGHNDIDYEHKTHQELSSTFTSEPQNQFLLNALLSLGKGRSAEK